jgi:two-component system nitrate/nitrite sensor histidine kinase NarX
MKLKFDMQQSRLKRTQMNKDTPLPNAEEKDQYQSIFESANDGVIIFDLESRLVVEANPAAWLMHGYNTREEFVGMQLTTCIHPDNQQVFDESIRAFQPDSLFDTRALHVCRDGSTFFAEWRGTAFTHQGRLCLLGTVRDISKRIQIEQDLHERVEIRTHEQATLLEISHTLASTLELKPSLILDQLRKIINYSHGGLFALEGSSLVTLAMRGTDQLEQSKPIHIHLNAPETLVTLFNGHRPIRIADVWGDTSQALFLRSLLDDGAAVLLEGMQSWMWVPLAVRGRIIGGVGVAESTKNYFTAHHADLALSVANQSAITMVNAELYGQAQELAVLEERQRLARNLHDAVNQSLFSAGLIAEVLPRLWDQDQQEARRSLEDLRRLTRGAMAEMRTLLAELRPSTLTDSSLSDLLRLLGNAFSGRTNIPVAVDVTGEFFLPAEAQVAFYRICQEALNNIVKHAKASQVDINLTQEEAVIEMCIRDNGKGFDTQKTFSGHYGLGMMQEHAEAAGALLTITSQPGQGTELTICWTITPPKESL